MRLEEVFSSRETSVIASSNSKYLVITDSKIFRLDVEKDLIEVLFQASETVEMGRLLSFTGNDCLYFVQKEYVSQAN